MNTEKNPFIGIAPAIMTPFRPDVCVDFDALLAKRRRLVQAGMQTIVWPGTMGNWSQLRPEERKEGVALLAKEGPLIVGTGAPNTDIAADYARHAREAGAAGLMIIPEVLYMGTVTSAQEHHFSRVVEAPCLGKNVMAATNALSCVNMSLADYDHLIPLDEVIEAMSEVGKALPTELKCTALGGLSITKTSRAIEAELERNRPG